jgi:polar amino acid transport system substrate-binding protein
LKITLLAVEIMEILALSFLIVGIIAFFLSRRGQNGGISVGALTLSPSKVASNRGLHIAPVIRVGVPAIVLLLVLFGERIMPSIIGPPQLPKPIVTMSLSSDLVARGELLVGTDTSYPPQTYLDPNTEQPTGFDIELISAIASHMGLRVKIVTVRSNDLIDDLKSRKLDVVISAYAITDRIKHLVQSIPYLNIADIVLVRYNNPNSLKFAKLTDLCGHTVGVQMNTTEDEILKNVNEQCGGGTPINIVELPDADAVGEALSNGQVEASYQDSPTVSYYDQKYVGEFMQLGPMTHSIQEGILIRRGDTTMLSAVNAAFQMLIMDDRYSVLLSQWNMSNDGLYYTDPSEVGK